jgi:hypothetical protein
MVLCLSCIAYVLLYAHVMSPYCASGRLTLNIFNEQVLPFCSRSLSSGGVVDIGEFPLLLFFGMGNNSTSTPIGEFRIYIANVCVGEEKTCVCASEHKFGIATNHGKLRCDWAPMSNGFYLF